MDPGPEWRPPLTEVNANNATVVASSSDADSESTQLLDGLNDYRDKMRKRPKRYRCVHCRKRFATATRRTSHLLAVHLDAVAGCMRGLPPSQPLPPPSIDTKIVEMLQKQGTHICLEANKDALKPKTLINNGSRPTSHPTKACCQDEILLSFDSVITEAIFSDNFQALLTQQELVAWPHLDIDI